MSESIKAIDARSIHSITSGQVVIDLQTAVKELVENSLDSGATSIDVRFQNYGLKSIEVVDNGSGIASKDHDSIALKHYTSKLSSFEDLSRVLTFGFRGEALSSLCALTDGFTVTTATSSEAPMGTAIEMDRNGTVRSKCKIARQRGTTVSVSNLFHPLPVRRKEFERNAKREFQKALTLLHAYALVPCALENKGVRLSVSHQTEGGRKAILFKTNGSHSIRASVTAVWGPKALENIVDLDLSFDVETEKSILKRALPENDAASPVERVTHVKFQGLISKFAVGTGRTSVDRQFFYVNGRPYNPGKVQKAMNEVYRTFNINQSPFVIANVILPTNACDINITPDKRTIFLHSENNLVEALKTALEAAFSSARSTYDVSGTQLSQTPTQVPQQNTQQTMSQGVIQPRNQKHDRGEKGSQQSPTSTRPLRDRTSSHATRPGSREATGGVDKPISMGVPHLLVDDDEEVGDEFEHEPEPTLVAQPQPKGSGRDGTGKTRDGVIDRPRTREPSEPLFFPQSGDEQENDAAGNVDGGTKKKGIVSERNGDSMQVSRPATTATTNAASSTSTSTATLTSIARSTTHVVTDKPRSVQTVLSTRGAAWNIRRDDKRDEEAGRERRQTRISIDGDRARGDRKSFRSSLSQFLSTSGRSKSVPDGRGEESGDESEGSKKQDLGKRKRDDGSEEEVDELDETDEDEREDQTRQGGKARPRPRTGSSSSQGTVVVLSDDEHAMDVDEPSSTVKKPVPGAPSSAPQTSMGNDDVDQTEEDWAFSSTLVGTYVPPAGKGVEAPPPTRTRPLAQNDTDSVTLRVNLINIGTHYLDMYNRLSSSSLSPSAPSSASTPSLTFHSAVSSANLDTAAEDAIASAALSRIITKSDFEQIEVVGQFNLGFILVRKRGVCVETSTTPTDAMDDLFIVDQHAADEKWNFETLQESTVIASQKLFRPRELHFTAADEMLAIENMDVLKRNGFELEQVEERETRDQGMAEIDEASETEGVRVRLRLVAQPMSKDTVFDIKDLEELIHLMQDRPRGTMVRCSKARAMFAMRACRRSVMVGTALDRPRMTAIVRHMGTMDQPWNCPHGRPTMRHLSDLKSFGGYVRPVASRAVEWEAYGRLGGGEIEEEEEEEA